jgi:rhomboid family GlyGly-CTERM serine protease
MTATVTVTQAFRRVSSGRLAWGIVTTLLLVPAAALGVADPLSRTVLGWYSALALAEPWRWWSAAWVHLSALHLAANLLGGLLVGALAWLVDPPRAAAWAWAAAWPLTQFSLLLQPDLHRYGGLSGVLHAGVALCACCLCGSDRPPAQRRLGLAVLAGLLLKVLLERPWGASLVLAPGWDFPVAPLAHAAGLFWGALFGTWIVVRRA